jgi:phage-related protein (TIGR01555 family)
MSPLSLERFAMALAAMAADAGAPPRPFKAPDLPPGVVPKGARIPIAMDDATAMYGWLNNGGNGLGVCGLGFPGYPYLSQLTQRSEYRAPTETIATELTREWVKFTGADEAKTKELETAFDDFGVRAAFREMGIQDGFFGRGQLSINIKGQDTDKRRALPLIVDPDGATIRKGDLLGFKSVEPIWTTPYAYNSNDPTKPDFYKPDFWYVLGKKTHASRLLTFIGRPVPDILKPSYNFSGLSLSQLIEPYVVRWLKTVDSVNRMISRFSVSGLATNMQSILEEGGEPSTLMKRAQVFNTMADNRGLMLLDKDSEEFFQFNTPLSGLSELQAQAQEHMAAPTHIPLVKLTGITPSGLNASAEGEIKVFYDFIAAEQENLLGPHLTTVLNIIQLHLWGKVDPDIGYEWVKLDAPSDKEVAEMRKADADAGVAYINAGVITADEERARLRMDPTSGYTGIEGDAPEAPMLQEHELGQESADADAQRQADAREHAANLAPKDKAD